MAGIGRWRFELQWSLWQLTQDMQDGLLLDSHLFRLRLGLPVIAVQKNLMLAQHFLSPSLSAAFHLRL